METMKPSPNAKKRNTGLSVWLVLMMVGAAWAALANFGLLFGTSYYLMPGWIVFCLGLIAVLNFVLLLYIWQWKMWAFQASVASTVLVFILNLVGGTAFWAALLGFLGVIILYLFMRPQWKWFE